MFFCSEIDGPSTGGLNVGGDVYAGGVEAIVISGMNEYPRGILNNVLYGEAPPLHLTPYPLTNHF